MKKKLAAIDMRIQIGAVVLGLLIFGFVLHMFLISPKGAEASKLQKQIDDTQVQIAERRSKVRQASNPPTIAVADLFKLDRAIPNRVDMPGMMLTLSETAREAGITFTSMSPTASGAPPVTGDIQAQRFHLMFTGNFYALSDFLYRLRSLVAVRSGSLEASGRLFNVDTLTCTAGAATFPQISAELYVDAYVYGATTATPSVPATTAPTTTDSSSTDAPPADGATAAGVTG